MNKFFYVIAACLLFVTLSCGDLDPRQLARNYCDCHKKFSNHIELQWKCDSMAIDNARKMNGNEEAQRAYNVQLKECME